MYGWTDPNDPDGAQRRPEPPVDEPAWLTDRPAPRSSYLFGDEPAQPVDDRHQEPPTGAWHGEQAYGPVDQPYGDQPTERWQPGADRDAAPPGGIGWREQPDEGWRTDPGWHRDQPTEQWRPGEAWHGDQPAGTWQQDRPTERWAATPDAGWHRDEPADRWGGDQATGEFHPTGGYPAFAGDTDLGAHREAGAGQEPADGRHRARRFPRPALIGGAAAAATLVVSLGVGAVALGGGGDERPDTTATGDDTVAAAPFDAGAESPADALAAPTPGATPTPTKPTPSPTKVTKPKPAPARTTAPSRRSPERSTAPAGGAGVAPGGTVSSQAREVVNLVNAERAKAGCRALGIDDKLMTAAQRHSQDQADHQDMSHTGSDGSDAGDRLDRVGYAWRTYGENVAWNQKTPAAVMDAWMNSPGHRANILNCAFTEIGVGVASSNGPYWTQVFAAPR
ncbi:CAP domain-containing protein [Micromonospora sp. C28SCA-DRY-2]|uniref:CAP domain-containing protein n=1 Tax=Micromonospora sp. C28SCA-DRY-2 TaxID=3059522 RepID=UPI0026750350|nr:CAP domain-containing protein [Micromonospora sp. C28SCA-DRY-2]MDO3700690.1 CAP domain-containing protein [Micromonospora sp. C28SCA-DRY-2]